MLITSDLLGLPIVFMILKIIEVLLEPSNSALLVIISKITQPKDQIST